MTERDKKIIELYTNNLDLTTVEIAKQFNISKSTISRIMRINNIPRRTGNDKPRFSKEEIQNIISEYTQGTSLQALQQKYHVSYDTLTKLLKENNCEKISSAKRKNINLQENYFSIIDSNEKAYWLGWLISDGAITNQPEKNKYQIELTLQSKDEDILHLLEQDLGVENKVYNSAGQYKRFSLGSKKIVADLAKLGITQNKTFSVTVPQFDPQYNAAFLRGLFDGDGGFCCYTRSNGKQSQELSFCGNEQVIKWVQKTLFNDIPALAHNSITQEHSIKRIRWSNKKDIKLIRDYLYNNDNNHCLKRKKDLIYANTVITN